MKVPHSVQLFMHDSVHHAHCIALFPHFHFPVISSLPSSPRPGRLVFSAPPPPPSSPTLRFSFQLPRKADSILMCYQATRYFHVVLTTLICPKARRCMNICYVSYSWRLTVRLINYSLILYCSSVLNFRGWIIQQSYSIWQ